MLTDLGLTLSAAFCGVWVWAAGNLSKRRSFGAPQNRPLPTIEFA
jgi:hypothetical protein